MGARTKYRKRALDILFESEAQGLEMGGSLSRWVERADPPVNPYTARLVEGVAANAETIDALISEHAQGWTLARMPGVDRNLLRVATFEILLVDDVPSGVSISEAVELSRELSTDESPRFIAGVLNAIVKAQAA